MGLKSWFLKRKALKLAKEEEKKHIISKKEQLEEQKRFLKEVKSLKNLITRKNKQKIYKSNKKTAK